MYSRAANLGWASLQFFKASRIWRTSRTWRTSRIAIITIFGQLHTCQKHTQNRPRTLRSRDKWLFVFWPMTFYSIIPLVSVITKITNIFGQGFQTRVSGKFSVSFAKLSDIRKQGSCTGLVSKSKSPKSPKYRENRKSEIFSQMHGLILNY